VFETLLVSAVDDIPMLKASPKRRKGSDSAPVPVDRSDDAKSIFKRKGSTRMANASDQSIDGAESSRFRQLSMKDSEIEESNDSSNRNIFLNLSTSPINHRDVDETPISKNTNRKKNLTPMITVKTDMDEVNEKPRHNSLTETPTPPNMLQNDLMTDEHTLNKHLRGQSFTPLPHVGETGISPSAAAFSAIAPSLSWSIAGDTPSLEDLAGCSWEENSEKGDRRRPDSTTSHLSSATSNIVISPHHFSLWKEDHESKKKIEDDENDKEDGESIRLSMLSPNSEIAMSVDRAGGTTTPLPIFFRDSGSDERENHHSDRTDKRLVNGKDMNTKGSQPEQLYHSNSVFVDRRQKQPNPQFFSHGPPRDGLPPTPVYAGSKAPTPHYPVSNMGVGFARSPLHGERRDFGHMFNGHHPPPGSHNDRIRNLRGRMPPGAHMAPVPIHIPPSMSTHHPLTSPMGLPGPKAMWSPHQRGMGPPMASPHHLSPMDITQSKRKCVPLKPPIPSKFQGDMEKFKAATVPEFTSLVNFPVHMSQKQAVNLPEGMRCCVMCGSACPCSSGNKKKANGSLGGKKDSRGANGQDISGDKNGYAIIPTQNKGLCTLCDVNVWVVANSGLEIKWCKGCKNFRPWGAFGDKGLATKCLRCRERQREKYALQKEEKEKARLQKSAKAKA
jgi:Zn-finger nucleic acid-binding protein